MADRIASYGAWAVVAGASEGLGAAFAEALARRGVNLVVLARRDDVLGATAERIRKEHGVEVEARSVDLADPNLPEILREITRAYDVGIGVYNAAYSPRGAFIERPLDDLLEVIDVNVRGPLIFARILAEKMSDRGRGGLVLMSSLAGLAGSPRLAAYAASKAFDVVLAESLWGELASSGVDVVASCTGAVRTPGYLASAARGREAPGTLDPDYVAERTLRGLGRGPRVVPGVVNRVASLVVGRWLPRTTAVSIMGSSTEDLD